MAHHSRTRQLVTQGLLLAVTSLIVRIIGLMYRMPLVNLLGDEGMGYYANSFNIYVFALMISSFALPSAISKLVAERI